MKSISVVMTVLTLGIIYSQAASALEVKPGGLIFAHYEFVASQHLQNGTTAQNYSAFEVSRIYLNMDAKVDDKVSAFINLEANLTSRDNKNNRIFLKNAELRLNLHKAAKLFFGLVANPWRGFEEGIWKHRFVSKILEDIEGLLPASDRGVRLSGQIPFFAYDAMIGNGEGTGSDGTGGNETTSYSGGGRFKDYTGKVAIIPFERTHELFKGLKLNALVHKGEKNETTLRDRLYGGLSYESKYLNLAGNYFNADNSAQAAPSRGEGFSFYTVVTPIEKFWLFARFDKYDPDIHFGGDSRMRFFSGLGYQVTKGVRVALDHLYTQQERRSLTRQDESIFFIHTEAKF
ncbi:MAG: hypothetical protein A3G85_06600 [Elusimicrobia bacterium RIFCSPLOWO2_12_FULL_39_28]|nr:MAG: hypothetical protein A3G85_06600 [Elusimicrobia bacterium RIFCSPLOWO2_12_FULL_39_28]